MKQERIDLNHPYFIANWSDNGGWFVGVDNVCLDIGFNEEGARKFAEAMNANTARVHLLAKALREAKYWLTDGAVPNKEYGLLPDSLSAIEAINEALKEAGLEG